MTEPEIVSWGRSNVSEYPEGEYRDSLARAFQSHPSECVRLDSFMTRQRFLAAGVAWAIDKGYLKHERDNTADVQCKVSYFALTDEGKKELLDQS